MAFYRKLDSESFAAIEPYFSNVRLRFVNLTYGPIVTPNNPYSDIYTINNLNSQATEVYSAI